MDHKRSELTLTFDIIESVCVRRGARDLLYLLVTVSNYLKFCFSFQEPKIPYFPKFHKLRTKEISKSQEMYLRRYGIKLTLNSRLAASR